jgi:hypothetical protein
VAGRSTSDNDNPLLLVRSGSTAADSGLGLPSTGLDRALLASNVKGTITLCDGKGGQSVEGGRILYVTSLGIEAS